ncbi:hypothetical protein CIPAW_14G130600 [Carya illinoinensis]|uniref:Uncharacterized protein n=1 Tax=Carya illinoinensis TaxID=32201 RepID=A0A8T1NMG4_CARIL|nr:hypothetical protein CIPAW_14G130600 [Carya illinoinensis]
MFSDHHGNFSCQNVGQYLTWKCSMMRNEDSIQQESFIKVTFLCFEYWLWYCFFGNRRC